MFEAFLKDKSSFKHGVILVVLLAFVLFGAIFVLLGRYNNVVAANAKDNATFVAQSEWLKKYDSKTVEEIEKLVLHPCKEIEVDKIQKDQLNVFTKHGVTVNSVRKANISKASKGSKAALKGAKTSVTFNGSWNNVLAVINEFEKQKTLVVITDLSLSMSDEINGRMDYVIYYR